MTESWMQAFTIVGSLGAFTFWLFTKLDGDIKSINSRLDGHASRTDQLYQMFIDLLKERK